MTPSVTETPTTSPTATLTPTLTETITPTATVTLTPTTTLTPTVTETTTLTPTGTTTQTVTQTPTTTTTVTTTQTATQTPTGTPPLTTTPTVTRTGTVTPGTPTASRTPTRTRTRTRTPTTTPAVPVEDVAGYIPVVGSTPGAFESFFKTSVQLLNPGPSTSTGRLIFHPAGTSGEPTDPSVSWSLGPGQIVSYDDVVAALGQEGLGSIDLEVGEGQSPPIVIARVYNDAGEDGTNGFTEPVFPPADVPGQGRGFLVGPSDTARFRYNIGIRTLEAPVSLTATVRDSAGIVLGTVTHSYPENYFVQTSAADFLGFDLGDDQSIEIVFTGGGLIAYGATIDNVTNDASAQFLPYVTGTPVAQGTEPASRKPWSQIMLAALALLGLGVGAVVAKR